QNYPNPFNPTTKISYSIKKEGLVSLKVYDVLGNEIAALVNEEKPEGIHEVEFNAANLPSGIYIFTFQANGIIKSKKMTVLK
ncbi:MAG: T9SS type A sorting domain-containing protein, partial [Ignavibacteriaceae bacterium]|nr:T9SS type A sorting domain-containing protein [Ignavibacteriaceae bacterium]